jgi:predicted type IV restriction endonuclease
MYRDLNLPKYPIKTKPIPGGMQVFDEVRKKWVAYTPEEHVRQQFIHHLIQNLGFAPARLAVEKGFKLYTRTKRWDIAYHNRKGEWKLLVEVKSTDVTIGQSVVDQIAQYNIALGIPYLIVTNGLHHLCFFLNKLEQRYEQLPDLPSARLMD